MAPPAGPPSGPPPGQPPGQAEPTPEAIPVSTTAPEPVKADLLPPVYRERIALHAARRRTVMVLVVALIAVVVGFFLASMRVGMATEARNNAEAEKAAAQAAVGQLSEVPRITALISEVTTGLEIALSGEVLFSELITTTAGALPAGTALDSMAWTLSEPAATAVAAAEGEVDLGDLAMNGDVCSFTGGSALLESLTALPELNNVWLSSTSLIEGDAAAAACQGQPQYTFAISADLSEQALSNRYLAEEKAVAEAEQQGAQ